MIDLFLDKKPEQTRVCVAMSGGVDSTAAVILLKNAGYQVFGLTMRLLKEPYLGNSESVNDAGKVAQKLGIDHQYLDFSDEFRHKVVDYFAESYIKGLTPTPCVLCNRHIKLGLLAEQALLNGADVIVTGHYADVQKVNGQIELHRAKDLVRDQSYFLFDVDKKFLNLLRCPLAQFSKNETRQIVKDAGVEIFDKPDSQDICFVQNGKYADLIAKLKPDYLCSKGDIVNREGKVLGQHNGIINYTIGQRRGLGIGGGTIYYVLKIDALKNQVVVGTYDELKCKDVFINQVNWLGDERPKVLSCEVKLRSRQNLVKAEVEFLDDAKACVHLLDDFYGAAAGQGCCFYLNNRVLGGGFIEPMKL